MMLWILTAVLPFDSDGGGRAARVSPQAAPVLRGINSGQGIGQPVSPAPPPPPRQGPGRPAAIRRPSPRPITRDVSLSGHMRDSPRGKLYCDARLGISLQAESVRPCRPEGSLRAPPGIGPCSSGAVMLLSAERSVTAPRPHPDLVQCAVSPRNADSRGYESYGKDPPFLSIQDSDGIPGQDREIAT